MLRFAACLRAPVFALLVTLSACADGDAPARCVPGASATCTCPDGTTSVQFCDAAGRPEACDCPDPEPTVDPVHGVCGTLEPLLGQFAIAVSVPFADQPILFFSNLRVDADSGTMLITLQALSLADGTPVGDFGDAATQVAGDGAFAVTFQSLRLPREANPASLAAGDADAFLELTLSGCTLMHNFACGSASGAMVALPEKFNLEGATWVALSTSNDPSPTDAPASLACPQ